MKEHPVEFSPNKYNQGAGWYDSILREDACVWREVSVLFAGFYSQYVGTALC